MKTKKVVLTIAIIATIIALLGGYGLYWSNTNTKEKGILGLLNYFKQDGSNVLVDDWKYAATSSAAGSILNTLNVNSGGGYTYSVSESMVDMSAMPSTSSVNTKTDNSTIGLTTGGSKNIENFRENIKNGYFPISTDITYNGLFYDYYFDTGRTKESKEMFSPSYSTAISIDPISGKPEYYMTVGLNSNIKQSDFARKKLNLVVVMDISGSMSSNFNSYYYDRSRNVDLESNISDEDRAKSKMEIANESLNLLLDELKPADKVGIVLFDDTAYLAKPMNIVEETNMEAIKKHVLEIEPQGGTNFSAGYTAGTELFTEGMLENSEEYENRIIVITDAMPNMGNTSKEGLASMIQKNANRKIYTTFIGVGVDFNTQVIETLSDVEGANYYSVHSSQEFKKIMSEDFEYMVTPLAFNIKLDFAAEDNYYKIDEVYGTDTNKKTDGTIMQINTLFPSSSNSNGENKGGVVLLKLSENSYGAYTTDRISMPKIKLKVSYKDRSGEEHSNIQEVTLPKATEVDSKGEYYANTGIRKAVALTRYANLMKNWILYERSNEDKRFLISTSTGLEDCEYTKEQIYRMLGEHERTSVKLSVSKEYKEIFSKFKAYLEAEITAIGDDTMNQEAEILSLLIK